MSSLRDMIVSIAFKDNASKAVQEVNKSMDAVKKAFETSGTSATKTSKAVSDVSSTMKNANSAFRRTEGGMKTTVSTMRSVQTAFQKSGQETNKMSGAMSSATNAVKTAGAAMKRTESGFKTSASTMRTVQAAFKKTSSGADQLSGTFRMANSAMKNTTSAAKPVPPELTRIQKAMKTVGDASRSAATSVGNFASNGLSKIKSAAGTGLSHLAGGFKSLPGIVGGAAMSAGRSITSFITAPLRGAVGMVQQYAGALGLLSGGALAASGMNRLSAIENARTSLTVMMGDAGKASKFMDEVLAFAKTTPFAFPDLAETSRNLIAFGMDEAKVVPTMKAIGDAAAATGKGSEGLNQVASAFGDMQISGKLGMDQINRLQAAGVPALKILSNQFGISTDDMKKSISKGAIDSVESIDMLVKGMQEGTKGVAGNTAAMAGIMEQTKENWTGSVDSLKSSISSTMAKLLEPAKPHIQNAMAWFGDTFSKLPDIVLPMVERMKPAFSAIGDVVKTAGDAVSVFFDVFKGGSFADFEGALDLQKMGFSAESANQIVGAITTVKGTLSDFWNMYKSFVTESLSIYGSAFESITPVIDLVVQVFQGLWDVIKSLFNDVIMPLIPIIQNTVISAFTVIQPVIQAVSQSFELVKSVVMMLVQNVIVPLIPVVSSIIQTAFSIISPILRIAGSLFSVIIDVVTILVNTVVKPLIPVIATVISGMWAVVKPILDAIATAFNAISDAIEWAAGKFKSFADAAKNFKMPSFGLPKFMGGNGLVQMGSHATGLGRVPYDEYPMFAHKDEAVLTAEQSNALRSAGMLKGDGAGPTLDMSNGSSGGGGAVKSASSMPQMIFNITGENPQEIGRQVRTEIEKFFSRLNAVSE